VGSGFGVLGARVYVEWCGAGVLDYRVRICGVGVAGLVVLAPRDYLSAFIKAGAIFSLAAGILIVRPEIQMPALTKFIDGSGPVLRGRFSVLLYYDCVRGNQRVFIADFEWHDAEDDSARRPTRG